MANIGTSFRLAGKYEVPELTIRVSDTKQDPFNDIIGFAVHFDNSRDSINILLSPDQLRSLIFHAENALRDAGERHYSGVDPADWPCLFCGLPLSVCGGCNTEPSRRMVEPRKCSMRECMEATEDGRDYCPDHPFPVKTNVS